MNDRTAERLLLFLWIVIALGGIIYQSTINQWAVITWDLYGYYLYLPAVFKYADLTRFSFVEDHHALYNFSTSIYQIQETPTGQTAPTYLYGLSLLYLPFYLLAEAIAQITPFPADGMSRPYQWCIAASGWVYGSIAFHLLYQLLRNFLKPVYILSALFLLLAGTNYGYYIIVSPASIHVELFFLYALLLWCSWRYAKDPDKRKAVVIGLTIGILVWSRPSEVVSAVLPPVLYLTSGNPLSKRFFRDIGLAALTVLLIGLPQLLLWKTTSGEWLYNPYPHTLDWLNPHLLDGLFSYRKGWFIYTPLMIFATGGFFLRRFYRSKWGLPIALFFLLNLYMVFCWPMWWYSSSYGMRALIQSYAVLVLPLAFCLSFLFKQSKWIGGSTVLIICLMTGLNLFQAWQYEQGIIPQDGTTETYYWKVFGATERDRMLYQYLDHEEIMPAEIEKNCGAMDTVLCASSGDVVDSFCSTGPHRENSPAFSYSFPPSRQINTPQWIRVTGEFRSFENKYDYYRQARWVGSAHIPSEEKSYYWAQIRLQRLTDREDWQSFSFDFRVPVKEQAVFKTYLWNNGPDTVRVRDIQVFFCPR